MKNRFATAAFVIGALSITPLASAESVVECRSVNYEYHECRADSLSRPQLIHQISRNSCILNRSWGFNPKKRYLWVADGCAGTFADMNGYHHGRGDTYDEGARHYDSDGLDAGAVVGGLVLGAILLGIAADSSDDHSDQPHKSQRSNPPEPGQQYFHTEDGPPEPGQTYFQGGN